MSAFLNGLREEGTFEQIAGYLNDPEYSNYHDDLLVMTEKFEQHPESYDGPCLCKVCRSYA